MPILYVHGVNVRSREGFKAITPYLERLVAPAISGDPANVLVDDVYWGDLGVQFAWGGVSRPLSQLLGMGAEQAPGGLTQALAYSAFAKSLGRLPADTAPAEPLGGPATGGLIGGGASPGQAVTAPVDLRPLTDDQLSDFLAGVLDQTTADDAQRSELILAADAVARDPATRTALAAAPAGEKQVEVLMSRIGTLAPKPGGLVPQGAPAWLLGLRDRVSETVRRGLGLPAYTASVVLSELRKPLHELVSVFIGDVCQYLTLRGTAAAPGKIPLELLAKLRAAAANKRERGGEPLVVLTHSMGGQLVYDAITRFLPGDPSLEDIHIDFWCATASQVGFFEEAKFFLASDPQYRTGSPAPFPAPGLGVWWNVWDPNDVLSFTARDSFLGVDSVTY
jgi:hypothetical protein